MSVHHGYPKWRTRARARFSIGHEPPWRWISVLACSCGDPIFALRLGWNVLPLSPTVSNMKSALWAVDVAMKSLGYRRMDGWKILPRSGSKGT